MRRALPALLLLAALTVPFAAARTLPDNEPIEELRENLGYAVGDERTALKALAEDPPAWRQATGNLKLSRDTLAGIPYDADRAVRQGKMSAQEAGAVKKATRSASGLDLDALAAIRRKDADRARELIEKAIAFKQQARLVVIESQQADDAGAGRECTATKQFELYAVPEGFAGSRADVFPRVPAGAKNIKVTFVAAGTGRPVPVQPFPGQTWTSEVKGRRPDGTLWVRVSLTGTGSGEPNEKHVTWKVVVGYDIEGACPK